ncbi:hypothetical protein M1146_05825 [Patescibacteria group bacterium]|nr:hypothetical protein [Patescibacteria group bacterium]
MLILVPIHLASRFGGMTAVGVSGSLEFYVKGSSEAPKRETSNKGVFQKLSITKSEEMSKLLFLLVSDKVPVPCQLKIFWVYPVFGNPFFGGRAKDNNIGVWFTVSKVDEMTLEVKFYIVGM